MLTPWQKPVFICCINKMLVILGIDQKKEYLSTLIHRVTTRVVGKMVVVVAGIIGSFSVKLLETMMKLLRAYISFVGERA